MSITNTYTEYTHTLSNGKQVKAYKGMNKCPTCEETFELDTTLPELFGKAKCLKCFMNNYGLG